MDLVERVDLSVDEIAITLNFSSLTSETATSLCHVVPTRIRRRGVETKLVLEGGRNMRSKPDPALIKAVVRAHRWFDDLVSGHSKSLGDVARAESVSDRYVSHLLPLAFLAPDIVEAILTGTQPVDLTVEELTKHIELPLGWVDQKILLCFD